MEPIIISASFFQEQLYLGVLGRTGEHEARRISFDCGEVLKTWPEATILCVCRRPCDTAAYPIPLTTDGTTYTMPLTSRETAASGTIKLELRAVQDDTVLKSAIFYGRILPSLNGQKDAPGNPLSDALNRLESTIADAQTLADEIRQKLDNGEFVGERGPQGEPGKDGSDANVTAENIQSALGYAPVTPSDLAAKQDVLTDADKQSITKIGMTTGAAWTSAEQAQARANIGAAEAFEVGDGLQMTGDVLSVKQGEYELIETFTLNEAGMVERTKEPDGRNYNFIGCIVLIHIGEVENNTSSSIYMKNSKTDANIGRFSLGNSVANSYGFAKADKINNVWSCLGRMLAHDAMLSANFFTSYATLSLNEGSESVIDKIMIFNLPIGTTITIKGLRADA